MMMTVMLAYFVMSSLTPQTVRAKRSAPVAMIAVTTRGSGFLNMRVPLITAHQPAGSRAAQRHGPSRGIRLVFGTEARAYGMSVTDPAPLHHKDAKARRMAKASSSCPRGRMSSSTFICRGAVDCGNWDIVEPQVNAKLSSMVDDVRAQEFTRGAWPEARWHESPSFPPRGVCPDWHRDLLGYP